MFDFSNFLKSGALLRHKNSEFKDTERWTLIEGPFSDSKFYNNTEFSICWPDFYNPTNTSQLTYFSSLKLTQLSTFELRKLLKTHLDRLTAEPSLPWSWSALNKHSFEESYDTIQNDLQKGEIQKAVLSLFAKSQKTPSPKDLIQIILNLTHLPQELHVFGFWTPERGVLGATPEVLFQRKGPQLTSMSLAGTRSKLKDSENSKDLLSDPKEIQEHQWVIDHLHEALSAFGPVQQSKTQVLDLPQLQHLQTLFEVKLNDPNTSPEALLKSLHPTPALGAFPKDYVSQKMWSFAEQETRWGFGSPISFLFPNNNWISLITIRSLLWRSDFSQIGVGCGIIKESQKDKEWSELHLKYNSILKNLGLDHG